MRVRIPNTVLVFNALNISALLLLSACSSSGDIVSKTKKNVVDNKATVVIKNTTNTINKEKPSAKKIEHTHPSNPCTATLVHSHVFVDEEHLHSYDCENTNDFVSNAHIHEATKKSRRFRHVHPNGANKHSHHRE